MQTRLSQVSWRWEQLALLLLLALSAAPASHAAWTSKVVEQPRALRRATFLRRGSSPSNAVDAADEHRAVSLSSIKYPGDNYLEDVKGTPIGNKSYYDRFLDAQNIGDMTRGTGRCKAWRSTTKCDPSGPRDASKDKMCGEVVQGDESGYCECGDYAQFASSPCGHRPFTCEVMCLKFAVMTHKSVAEYQGRLLSRDEAKSKLKDLLSDNTVDLTARKMVIKELIAQKMQQMQRAQSLGDAAVKDVDKYLSKIKEAQRQEQAATEEVEARFQYAKTAPWDRLRLEASNLIKVGRGIQAKVRSIMPKAFEEPCSSMNATNSTEPTDSDNGYV